MRRAVGLVVGLTLLAVTQSGCGPAPTLKVTTPEDVLGLSSRLVFSTTVDGPTAARFAQITNTGSTPIAVTDLTIGGASAGQFALADGQDTSFTIAADATETVGVRFSPTSAGNKFATLVIANDSSTPNYEVRLRGVRSRGTQGNTEPQLAQLMQLFGYSTNVGFTAPNQAITRAPVGDEVIAPYFVRVDGSKPVTLRPLARYVAANYSRVDSGRTAKFSSARQSLYRFPEDLFVDDTPGDGTDSSIYVENQKTFPAIYSGTFNFNPTAPFGIYGNFGNYSDDRFNIGETGTTYHNLRFFPAKGEGGAAIANAWIVAVDVNTNPPSKNFDYQDQVMLLTNARPELTPGPTPGSAATSLGFDAAVPGTVVDKDGEGTGFTSTQANKNGTQTKPELIDLVSGTLRITSTAGKSSGTENLQDNALQLAYDGSRTDTFVQARLVGPQSDLTAGFQQKAVYAGFDQDNYFKVEVEHRTSPAGVYITAFREQSGSTATLGQVALPSPGSIATLDLGIVADLETGTLRGVYRIDSDGAWTDLGTPFTPTAVTRFFSPQSLAGVLVSHTGSTTPIVGVYDSFAVS